MSADETALAEIAFGLFVILALFIWVEWRGGD